MAIEHNCDITDIYKDILEIIPSPIDMWAFYQRHIRDTMFSYVIARAYQNGGF